MNERHKAYAVFYTGVSIANEGISCVARRRVIIVVVFEHFTDILRDLWTVDCQAS